jgi:hypothetical protein
MFIRLQIGLKEGGEDNVFRDRLIPEDTISDEELRVFHVKALGEEGPWKSGKNNKYLNEAGEIQ